MTLSLTINETLKWLSSLPIVIQESFWWSQCSDRYILSLFPHLHTPTPPPLFCPYLISLTVSVDVKHHVYLPDCNPAACPDSQTTSLCLTLVNTRCVPATGTPSPTQPPPTSPLWRPKTSSVTATTTTPCCCPSRSCSLEAADRTWTSSRATASHPHR